MPFTDDDLKRLRLEYDEMSSDTIAALLARLEAAEYLIKKIYELDAADASNSTMDKRNKLVDEVQKATTVWRKVAGK